MSQQRTIQSAPEGRPPWSPLTVSAMAILFAGGGAILTIRNLERLGQIDRTSSRNLTYAAVGIFAVGLTILLVLAERSVHGTHPVDYTAIGVLSVGVAIVSYIVQWAPFRAWRASHSRQRAASWWVAIGTAFLYQLVVTVAATPIWFVAIASGAVSTIVLPR